MDVDSYNMVSREICSPLTGGPSGGRTSEVRCHRALILCGACSSRPYASLSGCGILYHGFPGRYALLKQGDLVAAVRQKCDVIEH